MSSVTKSKLETGPTLEERLRIGLSAMVEDRLANARFSTLPLLRLEDLTHAVRDFQHLETLYGLSISHTLFSCGAIPYGTAPPSLAWQLAITEQQWITREETTLGLVIAA